MRTSLVFDDDDELESVVLSSLFKKRLAPNDIDRTLADTRFENLSLSTLSIFVSNINHNRFNIPFNNQVFLFGISNPLEIETLKKK